MVPSSPPYYLKLKKVKYLVGLGVLEGGLAPSGEPPPHLG